MDKACSLLPREGPIVLVAESCDCALQAGGIQRDVKSQLAFLARENSGLVRIMIEPEPAQGIEDRWVDLPEIGFDGGLSVD